MRSHRVQKRHSWGYLRLCLLTLISKIKKIILLQAQLIFKVVV